jgi:hypothetical protein
VRAREERWIPDGASDALRAHHLSLSSRVLADEVVPLGAAAGRVAGAGMSFLALERWGAVSLLRSYWAGSDAAMYTPFECPFVQIDVDETSVIGSSMGGGSTIGGGCASVFAFFADHRPERLVVRRPARDGGPPLVEAEVTIPPAPPS